MKLVAGSVALGLVLFGASAWAEPPAPADPAGAVQRYQLTLPSLGAGQIPLVLRPETPGMMLSLSTDKRGPYFARCTSECALAVEPGEYWLTAAGTESTREGRRRVTIVEPTRLDVTGRDSDSVSTGLALGIIGPVLTLGGMIAMLVGAVESFDYCSSGSSSGSASCGDDGDGDTLIIGGLGALVTGLVLTPIGWVMFGKRAPTVNSTPLRMVR
jgi:hypothetical protein